MTTRTTCPYCGVGCGVLVAPDGRVTGDPAHPSNAGRLCSKGARLGDTLDDAGRLLRPRIEGRDADWDIALDLVARRFSAAIREHGPDSVACYVSGQCLTEDYYVANKLMKGFVGSANIDSNSRLCMAASVAGHVRAFGEDIVPGIYEDWDEADLVVLVGSNAAWCHPVLYQRLAAARAARGTRLVVIDPRRTATAEAADLHLPLAPGSDTMLFNGLLAHLEREGALDHAWVARHVSGLQAALAVARDEAGDLDAVAAACGIDPEAVESFYDLFTRTERVLTVWSQGVNQSVAGTDKVNAIINCHLATGRIGRPGMGPFSVTGQPNAMGGREVGGLANQLAAHLAFDDAADRATLAQFWRAPALAPRPGLKAVELFDAVLDGRIQALWILGTNPAASMPRAGRVREALAACPFVVASDCWETDTTRLARVVLPAAAWGEKDGTVTSSERRISRQRRFRASPGEARPDWQVLADVAGRMGFRADFGWDSPAAVFREHAALSGEGRRGRRVFDISALASLTDHDYDTLRPTAWPMPRGATGEGGRLFAAGGFPTPDGRAHAIPVHAAAAAMPAPFLLNTGRVRDQWHTMTRTGLVPALLSHTDEPRLAIHPEDAARIGLAEDALARVDTAHGSVLLRAELRHAQRRHEIFAPMHWTDAFAGGGPVARAVSAACDPHSGQPDLKATPAEVTPVASHFHGFLLRIPDGAPDGPVHWVRRPVAGGHLYRLTGLAPLPNGDALDELARAIVGAAPGAEWLEMADPARRILRLAALVADRLHAVLMLAPRATDLPDADTLAPLLGTTLGQSARARLLAGKPGGGQEARHVCSCFGIGRDAIRHAVASHHLDSVAAIGAHLGAGTNCGSCLPELATILAELRVPA